jgi:CheY-like chemotaxis protein
MTDPAETVQPSIYLVDDDPRMLKATARLLGVLGYACRTFVDGNAALAACAEHPPAVLVVDVFMPEPDGFEMIARMRRISPATRMIAVSGDMLRGQPAHVLAVAARMGADVALTKPIRPELMREALERLLGQARDEARPAA